MTPPLVIRTLRDLRGQISDWRGSGETVGYVPTMGALHSGHLGLVTLAKSKATKTVVSIFVNPTQFAPGEDLASYPREEDQDVSKLAGVGADAVYIPSVESMYDKGHATSVHVGGVADHLETDHRPTFFDGVAIVVTKLLNRVTPDIAVFGEKDYQQLATIRRMVRDLDINVRIVGAPIARDSHGLALSSRNQYFDADGLTIARKLNQIMRACAADLASGSDIGSATAIARAALLDIGFSGVDYVSVADAQTLAPRTEGLVKTPSRLLIAAHCRGVRLIDNCAV